MHKKIWGMLIRNHSALIGISLILICAMPVEVAGQDTTDGIRARELNVSIDPNDHPPRNFQRDMYEKALMDSIMYKASKGVMDLHKITYRSSVGDLDIPAYIFQPLTNNGPQSRPALVWVHGGVHGSLSPVYFPFIKEAVKRGYVVIAPEYRGSTGYGKSFYYEIDYGGFEIDDNISAVDYLLQNQPHVDPERIAMIGWSHGGFIALHSVFREDHPFQCGVAIVPVSNLIFRLSYKGPQYQRYFSTQKRIGGLPFEKPDIYVDRSPVYQVEKLNVPLLVHVATNDTDVDFVEAEMLIHALKAEKPGLAETEVYIDPPGGHSFSMQVDSNTLQRIDTEEQIDSWNKTWIFLEKNLSRKKPAKANSPQCTSIPFSPIQ